MAGPRPSWSHDHISGACNQLAFTWLWFTMFLPQTSRYFQFYGKKNHPTTAVEKEFLKLGQPHDDPLCDHHDLQFQRADSIIVASWGLTYSLLPQWSSSWRNLVLPASWLLERFSKCCSSSEIVLQAGLRGQGKRKSVALGMCTDNPRLTIFI